VQLYELLIKAPRGSASSLGEVQRFDMVSG
jgi:hypothetical protein